MKAHTVEHELDVAEYKLLNGNGDQDELALIAFQRTGKLPRLARKVAPVIDK